MSPLVLSFLLFAAGPPVAHVGRPALDASLVPPLDAGDANGVLAVRVSELFAQPGMAAHAERVNDFLARKLKATGAMPFNLPVRVQDVEQLTGRIVVRIGEGKAPGGSFGVVFTAVRMKKVFDWEKVIRQEVPTARKVMRDGAVVYEADLTLPSGAPAPLQFHVFDERTLLLEGGAVASLIEARKKPLPKRAWASEWKEIETGLIAAVLEDPGHRVAVKSDRGPKHANAEDRVFAEQELKVWRAASRLVVSVDDREGFQLTARFTCDCRKQAAGLKTLFEAARKELRKRMAGPPAHRPLDLRQKAAVSLFGDLADSLKIRRAGSRIDVSGSSKEGRWLEALGLVLGGGEEEPEMPPPVPVREEPVPSEQPAPVEQVLPPPADDPPPAPPVDDKQLREWRRLLKSDNADDRQSAQHAIDSFWPPEEKAVGLLSEALGFPQVGTRVWAARSLARLGPKAAEATAALSRALKDHDPEVRIQAAGTLSCVGPGAKEAAPALTAALEDSSACVRIVAALALKKIVPGDRKAIGVLIASLQDADVKVRATACCSLAQVAANAEEAIPALTRALQDKEPGIRLWAAYALGEMGAKAKAAVGALGKALKDKDVRVRMWAATALGGIGPGAKEAVPALLEALRDKDLGVQMRAACALETISPQKK
jgi:HEAT repeat protein